MFEKTFGVPYYGLDAREHVKTGLLLQFFQEAAALHADALLIGVADLLRQNMTWVLRRYRVRVHRYPGLGDLTVRTWYEPFKNLMSVRRFEMLDASGASVADAWSGWIVVDLQKGRPVRLDRALPPEYYDHTEPTGPFLDEPIPPVTDACCTERTFKSRWQELDLNGHTNHTVYFEWAMETVPDEVRENAVPVELDAEYLLSAKREEVVSRACRLSDDPRRFAHTILLAANGMQAARLSTTWKTPETTTVSPHRRQERGDDA